MTDERPVVVGQITLVRAQLDITQTIRTVQDMGLEHAAAAKEIARCQFAVPAQEETNRAREITKRAYFGGAVAIIGAVLMVLRPEAMWGLVALFGFLEAAIVGSHFIEKQRPKLPSST